MVFFSLCWFDHLQGYQDSLQVFTQKSLYHRNNRGGAFVAKLDSNGALQWNTFFGDSGTDFSTTGRSISIDNNNNVYVTGESRETWGSPIRAFNIILPDYPYDAFVAKLNPDGVLQWNTFLGGPGDDWGKGIAIDGNDNIIVVGYGFSTWESPVIPHSSSDDAFIAKLDSNGALIWNAFLGGGGSDNGKALALDGNGNILVTGDSSATWGSPDRAYSPGYGGDAFVAQIDSSGNLKWNTFLGGANWSGYFLTDLSSGIALDKDGSVIVVGMSNNTWGTPINCFVGFSENYDYGDWDAFVAKLAIGGTPTTYSISGRVLDEIGSAVTGVTISDGACHTTSTDINGTYSLVVPQSWSDTVTPTKEGYAFSPDNRGYFNVQSNLIDQNFTANRIALTYYTISGNTGTAGVTLSYIDGTTKTVISDIDGNYAILVPQGWTGVITPSKNYYKFDPPVLPYINVQSNFENEDYTAMLVDTDGDGLWDDWEVNGVDSNGDGIIDIDFKVLDEFGNDVPADPNKKDIYVYVNWLYKIDTNHTHKPSDEALNLVKEAFQRKDIRLHIILGGGVPETSENETLNKLTFTIPAQYDTTEFKDIRKNYFLLDGAFPGRASVFHYALFGHYLAKTKLSLDSSEQSPLGFTIEEMSSFVFGLQRVQESAKLSNDEKLRIEAISFMHELGHSLGLDHGGILPGGIKDPVNYKPNHLSIMNYSFGKYGLIYNGEPGRIDYSPFDSEDIPSLNENKLDENGGLNSVSGDVNLYGTIWYCGGTEKSIKKANEAIDWNCNGNRYELSVTADINNDKEKNELVSRDEWSNLRFRNGNIGIGFSLLPEFPDQVIINEIDLPAEIILEMPPIEFNQPPSLNDITNQPIQYSDYLFFPISAIDPDDQGNTLTFSATGLPNNLTLSDNGDGTAIISGIASVAPETYTAQITVTDPGGLSDTKPVKIVVTKEDARTTYTGPLMVSTGCATCSTATVPLRATIQDITAVLGDPAYDPDAGNITNATVSFIDRSNNAVLCTANVTLLDPANPKVGTATCNWTANIGPSYGVDYTIGTVVNGYYTRNSAEDDVVVVVSKPTSNFITGGGYFINQNSGGNYAGDVGLKTNFGLTIKFNQKLTNLQGRATIIVRQGGHVYQIKSNALSSLMCTPYSPANPKSGTAELIGKANITDVTDPLNPIVVVGNATLSVVMKDNGEPGSADLIGISLWSKDGNLLYSSSWDGKQTVKVTLNGGNLSVK